MSPPTKNGFNGSLSSSNGARPRLSGSASRNSNPRMNGGGGPSQTTPNSRSLRQQSEQLEQLLMEQQAKLEQKNMTESLQDLKEKLEMLQTFNNSSDNEQFDIHPRIPRSSHYGGGQEFLNNLHRYQNRSYDPMDHLRSENSKLKLSLQQQQEHIHLLTQSLNQCFQAVLTIQRDVSRLQQAVAVSSTNQNQGEASQATIEDNLDSISQQRDFESHSWDFDFQPQPSSRPSASATVSATIDPWNNFFSNQGGLIGGSESGVSTGNSGALNNTVLPGVRANNYWDNFRSFSRQNRLSSAVAANNIPSLTPIVAQVTPRQVPQLHLPHSPFRANLSMVDTAGTDHNQQLLDNAAMVEPFFSSISSPSRPRRKQKINREQNVSSSNSFNSRSRPEASVFPMPQQQLPPSSEPPSQQQPIAPPTSQHSQPLQSEVQPMIHQRQQVLNPVVTSIKRSIYTHVNELIAQNEERPEQLARIYHNLQNCMNPPEMMANLNHSSATGNNRRPWESMYQNVEDDDDDDNDEDDENNVSSTSLFKNGTSIKTFNAAVLASSSNSAPNDNRLALLAASSAAEVNSSGESSLVQEEDQQPHRFPLFNYEASSGIHDSLASLGAVGGTGSIEPIETMIKKQVNNEDTKQQNVTTVAVPKNIQRNIISRERDDRRKQRQRGEPKPRNMMCSNTTPSTSAAASVASLPPSTSAPNDMGFIPIKFRNDEQCETNGDQDLEPLEVEVGLDRVPTRLSSTELEAGRRQEDEENLQNLVDEVLNSTSSEVDFIVGNSDLS